MIYVTNPLNSYFPLFDEQLSGISPVSYRIGYQFALYTGMNAKQQTLEDVMRKYVLSFADSIGHKPDNPDRTARKPLQWDIQFQVWPNRASMARSIRMQQKGEPRPDHWKAIIPLTDGEGY